MEKCIIHIPTTTIDSREESQWNEKIIILLLYLLFYNNVNILTVFHIQGEFV